MLCPTELRARAPVDYTGPRASSSTRRERWRAGRGAPVAGGLLVGVRQPDQRRLAPRPPQQLDPDWKSIGREAAGHGDRRRPRVGAEVAVDALELLELIEQGGLLADGRIGEGVEAVVGHRLQDRLFDGGPTRPVFVVLLRVPGGDGLRIAEPWRHAAGRAEI